MLDVVICLQAVPFLAVFWLNFLSGSKFDMEEKMFLDLVKLKSLQKIYPKNDPKRFIDDPKNDAKTCWNDPFRKIK